MPESTYKMERKTEIQEVGQISLFFECASGEAKEYVKLKIDRQNKKVKLTSSQTNYQEQDMEWKTLWDKGKEQEQEKIAAKLSDEEFRNVFIKQMEFNGYRLIKSG